MASKQHIEEFAVSLPFTVGIDGKVNGTTDQSKIWQDRVLSAVGTAIGERVLNFTYGSNVYKQMYNNQTAATEAVRSEISRVFLVFLPLLTLSTINTTFVSETGSLIVEVIYQLPNDVVDSVVIGNLTLNGNFLNTEDM
jgi:phage baseplate assembly protein W